MSKIDKTLLIKYGQSLHTMRRSRGLSQADFGDKVGLSLLTIKNYEHAVTTPNIINAKLISDYFGVAIEDMMNGVTTSIDQLSEPDVEYTTLKPLDMLQQCKTKVEQLEAKQLEMKREIERYQRVIDGLLNNQ